MINFIRKIGDIILNKINGRNYKDNYIIVSHQISTVFDRKGVKRKKKSTSFRLYLGKEVVDIDIGITNFSNYEIYYKKYVRFRNYSISTRIKYYYKGIRDIPCVIYENKEISLEDFRSLLLDPLMFVIRKMEEGQSKGSYSCKKVIKVLVDFRKRRI